MNIRKIYEDKNGYVYPCEGGYKIHWKNEKLKQLKQDENKKFSKHWEAYCHLRSVSGVRLGI